MVNCYRFLTTSEIIETIVNARVSLFDKRSAAEKEFVQIFSLFL